MNPVAKEWVTAQVEQPGVLIYSEFAGAAAVLDTARLITGPSGISEVSAHTGYHRCGLAASLLDDQPP